MEPIWVAIITIVGGGLSGFGGALLKKWLDQPRERVELDDMVGKRLSTELERVYERLDRADTRLETAERQADVDRHNQDLLILHIGVLEGLVPPPPPPRPTLLKIQDLA